MHSVSTEHGLPPAICDLNQLGNGYPGVTAAFGNYLAEAAAVCLEHRSHMPGAILRVDGQARVDFSLVWRACSEQQRRCHNDLQCATEYGAYGVALEIVKALTGKVVVERSRKGTGFDYWLGDAEDQLFQGKVRLEVSGILSGDISRVQARTRIKLAQTSASDGVLPAYVVVVEFAEPRAEFTAKS